jgi:putative ABC transport system ATP-binding protein
MIKIKNLNKTFFESNNIVEIFKNLNMEIKSWDFVSIIGPSWSWKSTFINLLWWIDREYSWKIDIFWNDISKFEESEMTNFRWKNISYIFQNFKLIENLTLRENIDLVVEMNNLQRNFSTLEILKIVWLENFADNYVFNLSWWERQRVAIARAFVWKTKLLLADEPTWALDPKNKSIITDLIIDLHKKTKNTIIMITHDDEVAKISDYSYKTNNLSLIKN